MGLGVAAVGATAFLLLQPTPPPPVLPGVTTDTTASDATQSTGNGASGGKPVEGPILTTDDLIRKLNPREGSTASDAGTGNAPTGTQPDPVTVAGKGSTKADGTPSEPTIPNGSRDAAGPSGGPATDTRTGSAANADASSGSGSSGDARTQVALREDTNPPSVTARPPTAKIEAAFRTKLASLPCARVTPHVAEDGVVTLSGNVASQQQVADLRGWGSLIDGVTRIEPAVSVVPAPQCLAAAEISEIVPAGGPTPKLKLSRSDGIFRADRDVFMAEVGAPASFPAYLYVDYFDHTGEVYHLLPEPLARSNKAAAGATLKVGREAAGAGTNDRVWRLSEPYGDGSIVVIASETPLYSGLRELGEPIDKYLAFLGPALREAEQRGRVAVTSTDIVTKPGS
jgi:eukaryotic-like serine/threonine-protein kinase